MIGLKQKRYLRAISVPAISLICGVHFAHGAEVDVEYRLGGTYSDNARRTAPNESSDTIATAGLWLDVSEVSRRFDGTLTINVDHNVYTEDTFEDETIVSLAGKAEIKLAPRIFSWIVTNNLGQLNTDPFQPDTPINRENVNRFSTGPRLNLRLGDVTALELGGQYRNTWFEIGNFDNDVISGNISLVRALTKARSISINVTASRIEYDDSGLYSSFDRQSAFLAIQSRISRGTLNVEIGVNEIHDRGTTSDGILARLFWSREISSASSVSLEYDRRFSDAGDLFQRYQEIDTDTDVISPFTTAADPLEISRITAGYHFSKHENDFNLSFSQNEFNYENDGFLDRNISAVVITAHRRIGAAWRVGLIARVKRIDYGQSVRVDDDSDLSVSLSRQLSRSVRVKVMLRNVVRKSDAAGFNYEENRYSVDVTYSFRNH